MRNLRTAALLAVISVATFGCGGSEKEPVPADPMQTAKLAKTEFESAVEGSREFLADLGYACASRVVEFGVFGSFEKVDDTTATALLELPESPCNGKGVNIVSYRGWSQAAVTTRAVYVNAASQAGITAEPFDPTSILPL